MAQHNDNDLLISVSAKDADTGFRYVVPALELPAGLSPEMAAAINRDHYREMISGAQNAATKARKEGKNERAEVQKYLNEFRPSDRQSNTVAAKRMDITREMVAKALAARGQDSGDASVEANIAPWLAGPKGSGKNAEAVEKALEAFLHESYRVTKRGSGKSADGAAAAEAQDW